RCRRCSAVSICAVDTYLCSATFVVVIHFVLGCGSKEDTPSCRRLNKVVAPNRSSHIGCSALKERNTRKRNIARPPGFSGNGCREIGRASSREGETSALADSSVAEIRFVFGCG